MGNAETKKSAAQRQFENTERRLLDFGFKWWTQQQHECDSTKGAPGSDDDKKRPSFACTDVETEKGRVLHTVSVVPCGEATTSRPPLVLLHGYGGGLGLYYAVLPQLVNASIFKHMFD